MSDQWECLKEVREWIGTYALSCVGAEEMIDRISDMLATRVPSAKELAEKHGFKEHGRDPLTGTVLPPVGGTTRRKPNV